MLCVREAEVGQVSPEAIQRPVNDFDYKAAATALERAERGVAEVCGGQPGPSGDGVVTVTFERDGRVAGVQLDPPFEGSSVGACVARTFGHTSVPPFSDYAEVVKHRFSVPAS